MLSTSLGRTVRPWGHSRTCSTFLHPLTKSSRSHQRRNSSSSKPSRSADSPSAGPQQDASRTTASELNGAAEKRSSNRINRRRSKSAVVAREHAAVEQARLNLPSVPSTHHLHPADVAVSAFFSLHRPISVTNSVPSFSDSTSFNTIFTPRTVPNHNPQNVIATLSSAVGVLDSAVHDNTPRGLDDPASLRSAVNSAANTTSEVEALDVAAAASSPLQLPSHLLSGRYKPFAPPPVPTALDSSSPPVPADDVEAHEPSQKAYTTVLTIVESTDASGEKTYSARTTPIVSADAAQDARVEDPHTSSGAYIRRWREQMQTISVKRQRRLKMKKHKYKKLMKRTRNLRRRLDRN